MAKATKPSATNKKQPAKKPAAGKVDLDALDGRRDDTALNGSASALAEHAEGVAEAAQRNVRALGKAKVSAGDVEGLITLAAALRKRETAWRNLWKSASSGAVAKAREPARAGRDQLFSALRVFADGHGDTQAALDDIAGVENDTDLLSDLERLLALAKAHGGELAGTDTDEAEVATIAATTEAFRKARVEVRASGPSAGIELSDEAVAARRARNRVYWALWDLDRQVCLRASHAFRGDARKLRLFAMFTQKTRAREATPKDAQP